MFCTYYQAKAVREKTWFVAGTLRNEDHWVFDRTLTPSEDIIEFFVAPAFEELFVDHLEYLLENNYIYWFKKLPNRAELEGKVT